MLRELSDWTSEYRGGVTRYQDELVELKRDVAGTGTVSGVLPLVEQIMESNLQLQSRLSAAEQQLEQQTKQLESYLSEARTDGLTGLANRRAFDKKLDEMFAQYQRGGESFALALVDIDHFKKINDTHGHQIGDAVLRSMADRMTRGIESAVMVARFGGEEFAILLPAPLRSASEKMDAFRRSCAAKAIDCDGLEVPVTVSIGVSQPQQDTIIGPLVRRADEALYAAKKIGRNRTYYHHEGAPALFGAPEIAGQPK
jgi:diguanylate cyclase